MIATKKTHAFIMLTMAFLWGCAPTEEERKEQEEIEKNKPSLSIQPIGPLTEPETGSSLFQANVLMSKTIEENVTVTYSIQSGTASSQDVEITTGTLSIPAGSSSATFDVTVYADDLDEADEEFTLKLTTPSDNAKLGTSTQSVSIEDAALDITPSISIESATHQEPEEKAIAMFANVNLSKATALPVEINYSFKNITATHNDYQGVSGTLVIPPHQSTAQIDFKLIEDDLDELDETFEIILSNPKNATLNIDVATITIEDSVLDVSPEIFIESKSFIEPELNGEIEKHFIEVKVSKPSSFPITIDYSFKSNTATIGSDFDAEAGTLQINPGDTIAQIDFEIKGDDADEFSESFDIVLSNPTNAKLETTEASITIDDAPLDSVRISFPEINKVRVSENTIGYKLKINLSGLSEKYMTIPYTLSGLASNDDDYVITTSNPILASSDSKEVEISIDFIEEKYLPEGGESLVITLKKDSGTQPKYQIEGSDSFTFIISGDLSLNDTGVIKWYDGYGFSNSNPNPDPEDPDFLYPNQDADFGRDALESNDDSDGPASFSFTLLDLHGNPVDYANEASCVEDNTTGLIFELKQSDKTLPTNTNDDLKEELESYIANDNYPPLYTEANKNWRANNFKYSWFNSNDAENGGEQGTLDTQFFFAAQKTHPISNLCALPKSNTTSYDSCNSEVYASALNDSGLCGLKNWSLPTIEELRSIYNYGEKGLPVIFFPNSKNGNYLSSSPVVNGDGSNSGSVWCQSNTTGQVLLCNKNTTNYIRMVSKGAE